MAITGWYGFDLDGTLAVYSVWNNRTNGIGKPIPKMIDKVRELKEMGKQVKVFTHRVNSTLPEEERETARKQIEDWCEEHIGYRLPVTSEKDAGLIEFYDDSAIQVESNCGNILIPPYIAKL